jgi:hypothetical protein
VTVVRVEFEVEKETPGTFKFQEVLASEFDPPKIGTLYVKKPTLGEIGFERGKKLVVVIGTESDSL